MLARHAVAAYYMHVRFHRQAKLLTSHLSQFHFTLTAEKGNNMAKKRSRGASKSGAIRDCLIQNPNATASTIVPELAQRGIDVSPALVNQIKTRMKRAGELGGGSAETVGKKTPGAKKKARRKRSTTKSVNGAGNRSGALSADDLIAAKKLADELGGIGQARTALKYLEELG